jgi:hypothetical protein
MGSLACIENLAGRDELRQEDAEFAIEFQNTDRFSVAYTGTYEFLPRPFEISDGITLPVGSYDYDNVKVGWNLGLQRSVAGNFLAEYGTFYGGTRAALGVSRGRVAVSSQLALEPTYTVNWVDLPEGSFTDHLTGARVTFTMSPRMFVSSLMQYTSSNDAMTANVRLRWEYQPGSELFVVYNEERETAERAFPSLSTRALIVKINRLWRF